MWTEEKLKKRLKRKSQGGGGKPGVGTGRGAYLQSRDAKRCFKISLQGFPGGAVVENLPANAGDTGLSPGPGRFHMPRSN